MMQQRSATLASNVGWKYSNPMMQITGLGDRRVEQVAQSSQFCSCMHHVYMMGLPSLHPRTSTIDNIYPTVRIIYVSTHSSCTSKGSYYR